MPLIVLFPSFPIQLYYNTNMNICAFFITKSNMLQKHDSLLQAHLV